MVKDNFKHTPEEARALLVADLRSGRARQGRGQLATYDGYRVKYCCLGRAHEVFRQHEDSERVIRRRDECNDYDYIDTETKEERGSDLLEVVRRWLGFTGKIGSLNHTEEGTRSSSLIGLNDEEKFSFKQIADVIEAGNVATFNGKTS